MNDARHKPLRAARPSAEFTAAVCSLQSCCFGVFFADVSQEIASRAGQGRLRRQRAEETQTEKKRFS